MMNITFSMNLVRNTGILLDFLEIYDNMYLKKFQFSN